MKTTTMSRVLLTCLLAPLLAFALYWLSGPYLIWGILVTVLCCLPLGIVSIVKSTQVSGLWAQGRAAEAQQAADDAKKYAVWGAIAGVIVFVIVIIFNIVVGFSATSSYS